MMKAGVLETDDTALRKPIVLAPVIGTLISLIGWALPLVALAALREIGQAAGGLALFVTGLVLSERPFRLSRNTMFGAGIANIAQPLIAFAICRELDASVLTTKLSVVMAALPFGFFGILFGTSYRRISDEANSIIIASTIFSHSSGVQRISYMPRAQHVPLDSNAPTEMID